MVLAHVTILTKGAIQTMSLTKRKRGAIAIAIVFALAIATPGVVAWQGAGVRPAPVEKRAGAVGAPDDLMRIATEMMGSPKTSPVQNAERGLELVIRLMPTGEATPQDFSVWSRRLLDAKLVEATTRQARIEALKTYAGRSRKLREDLDKIRGTGNAQQLVSLDAEFRAIEADRWLAEAEAETTVFKIQSADQPTYETKLETPPKPPVNPSLARIARRKSVEDQRNQSVEEMLDRMIAVPFKNETPLEDIVKYLEQATQDEQAGFPNGIPIYVDPNGLKRVKATLASTVTINLQGIPLRTTLRLILDQLDLVYTIEDGVVIVSTPKFQNGGFQ